MGLHPKPGREINDKDRLVYKVVGEVITITQCRGHYEDK